MNRCKDCKHSREIFNAISCSKIVYGGGNNKAYLDDEGTADGPLLMVKPDFGCVLFGSKGDYIKKLSAEEMNKDTVMVFGDDDD